MRTLRYLPTLVLVLLMHGAAAAQGLTPEDFAYGLRIDSTHGAAVEALLVPPAVYAAITRPDLGDVRVFNAQGEELPHAVYRLPLAQTVAPEEANLPFFPVQGRPGDALGDLTVQVRRTESGALVWVQDTPPAANAPAVRAYVIDASELEDPVQALTLAWADSTEPFLADVFLETSDDLTTWRRWGTPTTLTHLRYAGNTLRRNEVVLPAREADYYRLRWQGPEAPPPVASVTATLAGPEAVPERQWVTLPMTPVSEGAYRADQNGLLPIDRVRLNLPQPNTLARARLESAASPEGPWTMRYDGLIYRLQVEGHEIVTPPIRFPRTTDRYWTLTVDPAGGGIGGEPPALELGWLPERLLFVARGAPPFTLAYGSGRALPSNFDAADLLQLLPTREAVLEDDRLAATGTPYELGGPARLEPDDSVSWPQILLWATLVFGVGLLILVVLRLVRQLSLDPPAGGTDPAE